MSNSVRYAALRKVATGIQFTDTSGILNPLTAGLVIQALSNSRTILLKQNSAVEQASLCSQQKTKSVSMYVYVICLFNKHIN